MEALDLLDRSLAAGVSLRPRAGPTTLARALHALVSSRSLYPLLGEVASDERMLRVIAERSYAHPNGFLKIVLLSRCAYQLRLHLWPGAAEGADEGRPVAAGNVHNHRWDFAATVLRGGYRHQEFVVAPDGEHHRSYAYEAQRGAGAYSLTYRGDVGLRCVFDAFLPAGSSYWLASDVVHRVSAAAAGPTASLILQGAYQRCGVDVFSLSPIATGDAMPLAPLPVARLRQSLRGLLSATRCAPSALDGWRTGMSLT
jgi:hypothetical protein